jgi:hypothetical protein
VPTGAGVAAMADRTVLLPLLLVLLVAFPVLVAFAVRPWLLRVVPPAAHAAGHLVHTAPGRLAGWVLIAEIAAGPLDEHPDTYAARAGALSPLYTDRTTTPGGPR